MFLSFIEVLICFMLSTMSVLGCLANLRMYLFVATGVVSCLIWHRVLWSQSIIKIDDLWKRLSQDLSVRFSCSVYTDLKGLSSVNITGRGRSKKTLERGTDFRDLARCSFENPERKTVVKTVNQICWISAPGFLIVIVSPRHFLFGVYHIIPVILMVMFNIQPHLHP